MKIRPLLVLLLCSWFLLLGELPVQAKEKKSGSLWNRQADPNQSPYADKKKETKRYKLHDHITIQVKDIVNASNTSRLDTKRESTIEFDLEKFLRFKGGHLMGNEETLSPGIDLQSDKKHKGYGRQSKRRSFTTTITAEVVDVLPNGNLLLEAKKSIQVDDDKESIALTGLVNPLHVNLLNDTVASEKLVDLKVKTTSEGPIADASKPGWLSRLWDMFWPF